MRLLIVRTPFCAALLSLGSLFTSPVLAEGEASQAKERARMTAVTLNYCRASFHRIRKYQSMRVILEEKEKILNNLNLNGIANEEVIKLYSSVLDEMSQIEVADRESQVFHDKYKKSLSRQVGSSLFILSAQLATASLEGMVRTGVNSWLDYRDLAWTRELDQWKIEKARIEAVVDKSSRFLDTFWKLAQQNEIPDRWLIRGKDLDLLMAATQETDLEKRLRILNRMKPYMECYPPYWYYLARTQQGLGRLIEASDTYEELDKVADGHFRRDDMLAASLANLAMIRVHLQKPGAEEAALEALAKSSSVWEVNLMCAQVLERFDRIPEAEDAILRNLDVDLERPSSSVALVGLLYRQNDHARLAETLADEEMLEVLPVLSLVQCMQKLGPQRIPPAVTERIRQSLRVVVEPRFGKDDLLIACSPTWQPQFAQIRAVMGGNSPLQDPERTMHSSGDLMLRFRRAVDGGGYRDNSSLAGTVLEFRYPDPTGGVNPPSILVRLGEPVPKTGSQAAAPWWTAASPSEISMAGVRISLVDPPATAQRIAVSPQTGITRPGHTGAGPANPVFPTPPPADRMADDEEPPGPDREIPSPAEDTKIPKVRILGVRSISDLEPDQPPPVPPPPED